MWDVIEFVRFTGSSYRVPLGNNSSRSGESKVWHSLSSETSGLLARLRHRGRTAGALGQRLRQYANLQEETAFAFSDLAAAATRDGLVVNAETIALIASNRHEPCSPDERIVANAVAILRSLNTYSSRPFDRSLFNGLMD